MRLRFASLFGCFGASVKEEPQQQRSTAACTRDTGGEHNAGGPASRAPALISTCPTPRLLGQRQLSSAPQSPSQIPQSPPRDAGGDLAGLFALRDSMICSVSPAIITVFTVDDHRVIHQNLNSRRYLGDRLGQQLAPCMTPSPLPTQMSPILGGIAMDTVLAQRVSSPELLAASVLELIFCLEPAKLERLLLELHSGIAGWVWKGVVRVPPSLAPPPQEPPGERELVRTSGDFIYLGQSQPGGPTTTEEPSVQKGYRGVVQQRGNSTSTSNHSLSRSQPRAASPPSASVRAIGLDGAPTSSPSAAVDIPSRPAPTKATAFPLGATTNGPDVPAESTTTSGSPGSRIFGGHSGVKAPVVVPSGATRALALAATSPLSRQLRGVHQPPAPRVRSPPLPQSAPIPSHPASSKFPSKSANHAAACKQALGSGDHSVPAESSGTATIPVGGTDPAAAPSSHAGSLDGRRAASMNALTAALSLMRPFSGPSNRRLPVRLPSTRQMLGLGSPPTSASSSFMGSTQRSITATNPVGRLEKASRAHPSTGCGSGGGGRSSGGGAGGGQGSGGGCTPAATATGGGAPPAVPVSRSRLSLLGLFMNTANSTAPQDEDEGACTATETHLDNLLGVTVPQTASALPPVSKSAVMGLAAGKALSRGGSGQADSYHPSTLSGFVHMSTLETSRNISIGGDPDFPFPAGDPLATSTFNIAMPPTLASRPATGPRRKPQRCTSAIDLSHGTLMLAAASGGGMTSLLAGSRAVAFATTLRNAPLQQAAAVPAAAMAAPLQSQRQRGTTALGLLHPQSPSASDAAGALASGSDIKRTIKVSSQGYDMATGKMAPVVPPRHASSRTLSFYGGRTFTATEQGHWQEEARGSGLGVGGSGGGGGSSSMVRRRVWDTSNVPVAVLADPGTGGAGASFSLGAGGSGSSHIPGWRLTRGQSLTSHTTSNAAVSPPGTSENAVFVKPQIGSVGGATAAVTAAGANLRHPSIMMAVRSVLPARAVPPGGMERREDLRMPPTPGRTLALPPHSGFTLEASSLWGSHPFTESTVIRSPFCTTEARVALPADGSTSVSMPYDQRASLDVDATGTTGPADATASTAAAGGGGGGSGEATVAMDITGAGTAEEASWSPAGGSAAQDVLPSVGLLPSEEPLDKAQIRASLATPVQCALGAAISPEEQIESEPWMSDQERERRKMSAAALRAWGEVLEAAAVLEEEQAALAALAQAPEGGGGNSAVSALAPSVKSWLPGLEMLRQADDSVAQEHEVQPDSAPGLARGSKVSAALVSETVGEATPSYWQKMHSAQGDGVGELAAGVGNKTSAGDGGGDCGASDGGGDGRTESAASRPQPQPASFQRLLSVRPTLEVYTVRPQPPQPVLPTVREVPGSTVTSDAQESYSVGPVTFAGRDSRAPETATGTATASEAGIAAAAPTVAAVGDDGGEEEKKEGGEDHAELHDLRLKLINEDTSTHELASPFVIDTPSMPLDSPMTASVAVAAAAALTSTSAQVVAGPAVTGSARETAGSDSTRMSSGVGVPAASGAAAAAVSPVGGTITGCSAAAVECRPVGPPAAVSGSAICSSMVPSTAIAECWHEVWATRAVDPVTGRDVLVLAQHDVTAKVVMERHLALVMETEHRLLEQLFPRHILAYITEEWTQEALRAATAPPQTSGFVSPKPGASQPQPRHDPKSQPQQPPMRPMARDCTALATWHEQVTLLFADIKGFTPMCKEVEPRAVMSMLNDLYSRYDKMLDKYGVFKVETIGDCYFVAGGLMHEDEDGMVAVRDGARGHDPLHARKVFMFAKAMLEAARQVSMPTTGEPVQIRIGIATGPVVSGVVGLRMPRFCLFGDTVNTASRMESTGVPGAIHVSQATYELLRDEQWVPTGGIEVKGKGHMQTYLWRESDAVELPLDMLAAGAAEPGVRISVSENPDRLTSPYVQVTPSTAQLQEVLLGGQDTESILDAQTAAAAAALGNNAGGGATFVTALAARDQNLLDLGSLGAGSGGGNGAKGLHPTATVTADGPGPSSRLPIFGPSDGYVDHTAFSLQPE